MIRIIISTDMYSVITIASLLLNYRVVRETEWEQSIP